MPQQSTTKVPYRQIRAFQNLQKKTLFVYAAFPESIATAAVKTQRLDASPNWLGPRMTWVKPSWSWMMYRCGYSFKDKGQARVLAIEMKWEDFEKLLEYARVHDPGAEETADQRNEKKKKGRKQRDESQEKPKNDDGMNTAKTETQHEEAKVVKGRNYVRVQWDPERTPRLGRLEYRSIQIGIPGEIKKKWLEEWIQSITDVTERAQNLKAALDETPTLTTDQLVEKGHVPPETVYELPQHLREILAMDRNEE